MDSVSHFIEFPALGWHFDINPVAFEFDLFGAHFTVNWYGILIAVGFLLAVLYAFRRAKDFSLNTDRMLDVILISMIGGVIGARLYYVLFSGHLAAYLANPISIIRIWDGGLAIYGGIITAFLVGLLVCRLRKVPALPMFDLASLGFLIGQCIGRWGNFCNQEAYGTNTTLPWGMTGDIIASGTNGVAADQSAAVHPTFLYESLWCLLGFILLHIISKKCYKFGGQIFSLYLIWYGAGRFCIESLRTDSLMIGSVRVSQMVAVIAVILGIILFFVFRSFARRMPSSLLQTAGGAETEAAAETEETEAEENVETAANSGNKEVQSDGSTD